jgi:hypothetical protein
MIMMMSRQEIEVAEIALAALQRSRIPNAT